MSFFELLVYVWIALAIGTFISLFWVTAPFGRHTSDSWGPTINARLAWCLMEIPSPLVLSIFLFSGTTTPTTPIWIFWGLWMLHYINRSLIYPFRQRDVKKRMPMMIMGSAIFFNLMNGGINGYFLGYLATHDATWLADPRFIVGLCLFLIGMFINWQSDNILLKLRKPGETAYKIPYGGFFKYVSCPNLFGEVVEWFGFALMVYSLPALSFALWTFANLVPRALDHHQWYLQKFENYPTQRKAVFPFLW